MKRSIISLLPLALPLASAVAVSVSSSDSVADVFGGPRCGRKCCLTEDRYYCRGSVTTDDVIEDIQPDTVDAYGCWYPAPRTKCCIGEDGDKCIHWTASEVEPASNAVYQSSQAILTGDSATKSSDPIHADKCWRVNNWACCETPQHKLRCAAGLLVSSSEIQPTEQSDVETEATCWQLRDKFCCKLPNGKLRCTASAEVVPEDTLNGEIASNAVDQAKTNCWRLSDRVCCELPNRKLRCTFDALTSSEETALMAADPINMDGCYNMRGGVCCYTEQGRHICWRKPGVLSASAIGNDPSAIADVHPTRCYYDRTRKKWCCRPANGQLNCGPFNSMQFPNSNDIIETQCYQDRGRNCCSMGGRTQCWSAENTSSLTISPPDETNENACWRYQGRVCCNYNKQISCHALVEANETECWRYKGKVCCNHGGLFTCRGAANVSWGYLETEGERGCFYDGARYCCRVRGKNAWSCRGALVPMNEGTKF